MTAATLYPSNFLLSPGLKVGTAFFMNAYTTKFGLGRCSGAIVTLDSDTDKDIFLSVTVSSGSATLSCVGSANADVNTALGCYYIAWGTP